MKNQITKITTLLLLILCVFACKEKENIEEICTGGNQIDNRWIWVQSAGGEAGEILTPESEMLTRKLVIDEVMYREYVNDSLVFESEYEIGVIDPIFGSDSTSLKLIGGAEYAMTLTETELTLYEMCFDCYIHYYVKE